MFQYQTLMEGKWAILILSLLTILGMLWCKLAGLIALSFLFFTISFFRDPNREIPSAPSAIVSPADGKVVDISTMKEPLFLHEEALRIAIFLSVFDVHVQRAPTDGRIVFVAYNKGKFLDARNSNASLQNENRIIGLESTQGVRFAIRQIAGLIARRIVGWSGNGDVVKKGERIGMIRFGSRVELFLPVTAEIKIQIGTRVKGGETIIAYLQKKEVQH